MFEIDRRCCSVVFASLDSSFVSGMDSKSDRLLFLGQQGMEAGAQSVEKAKSECTNRMHHLVRKIGKYPDTF